MGELSSTEQQSVDRAAAEPMLDQVFAWAAVNSGSRNLAGLETMAGLLTDAYSALPGILRLEHGAPVDTVDSAGRIVKVQHGRHLHQPGFHLTRGVAGGSQGRARDHFDIQLDPSRVVLGQKLR